jgi:23S rRNA (pseudouridine1915-N3)-methyltransferase
MKLLVPLIGKTKESYLDAGIRDYAGRLARFVTVDMPVLRERHSRTNADEVVKAAEAALLLEQAASAQLCVALDPNGVEQTSQELAGLLSRWEQQGIGTLCFLIGGHLGLHASVLDRTHMRLSLSRLTFTHEMSRLILLEQLYRAYTIKAGGKYHK